MKKKVLIIEDNNDIRENVVEILELADYVVFAANNGKIGVSLALTHLPDIILCDIMMPELDGYGVLTLLNKHTETESIPFIFLTAKAERADMRKGMDMGADDYLTKPFNLEELLLRVQNLLKRSNKQAAEESEIFKFGNNDVNFSTFEAKGNQGDFTMTKKEAMLLKLLVERKNEVVSRNQILQFVWGYDVFPSTRTIDNFILSFRKYFEEDPHNPKFFQSIRGVGYKFVI